MELPAVRKLYAKDFAELDVQYTEQCIIDEAIDRSKILEAAPGYETDANIARFTAAIKTGYQSSLYLKYINERIGYGTFADAPIQKDDIVGEYTGKVIQEHTALAMPGSERTYLMALSYCYADYNWPASLYIDAKKMGNFTRFINHRKKPNVICKLISDGYMWHVILVATKHIAKDKQLFINYGDGYWQVHETLEELNPI